MAFEVIFLPKFEQTLQRTLDYLAYRWNDKVVDDFLARVYEVIASIAENPAIHAEITSAGVRQAFVTKHNQLLYQVNGNIVELLSLFDTRQNPDKKLEGLQ